MINRKKISLVIAPLKKNKIRIHLARRSRARTIYNSRTRMMGIY